MRDGSRAHYLTAGAALSAAGKTSSLHLQLPLGPPSLSLRPLIYEILGAPRSSRTVGSISTLCRNTVALPLISQTILEQTRRPHGEWSCRCFTGCSPLWLGLRLDHPRRRGHSPHNELEALIGHQQASKGLQPHSKPRQTEKWSSHRC